MRVYGLSPLAHLFRQPSSFLLVILLLPMIGCRYEDYSNQLQSANDMRALGFVVSQRWNEDGPLTEEEIKEFARQEGLDRDRWGHELAVRVETDSWVLAYPGRDGDLDIADLSLYAGRGPVDIQGLYDHDLVYEKDRYLLTIASKDSSGGRFKRQPLIPEN